MKKKLVLEILPTKGNARNTEGAFLRAPNGDILFAYSRYNTGGGCDDSPCDIAMIRSSDEGETWSEPLIVAEASFYGVKNIMSVSGMTLKDGRLCWFFLIKENDGSSTIGRSVSADGISFVPSRCECKFLRNYYVVNNDRFIRLEDGRIAAPAAKHDVGLASADRKFTYGYDPAVDVILVSEDEGGSFTCLRPRISLSLNQNLSTGMQEPGLLECGGGRYYLWARTNLGCQYECWSFDGLNSFTPPEPSQFTSPCSPMQVKRLGDAVYTVYNPIPNYNGRVLLEWSGRTPIVIRKSTDGGKTFGPLNVIADRPDFGYCYPALFETNDGALLCGYCCGGAPDGGCLSRLNIMKMRI